MQLLLVRHAIAVESSGEGVGDDAQRALTAAGRKKMTRGAAGLCRAVRRLDLLGASPLLRAQQTAEIVADAFGGLDVVTVDELAPGTPPASLGRWLGRQRRHERVAVVGHEPHLSGVVSWLIAGSERAVLEMKKGGACLLDLPEDAGASRATLLWSLRPRHLRALGR